MGRITKTGCRYENHEVRRNRERSMILPRKADGLGEEKKGGKDMDGLVVG